MSRLPQRDLIARSGQRIASDCSARTEELNLREDKSDAIEIFSSFLTVTVLVARDRD